MNHSFVPFMTLAAAAARGSATPAVAASNRQSFKPIQSEVSVSRMEPGDASATTHEPVVKVEKDGDTVRRIQIVCSCGQLIELECQY